MVPPVHNLCLHRAHCRHPRCVPPEGGMRVSAAGQGWHLLECRTSRHQEDLPRLRQPRRRGIPLRVRAHNAEVLRSPAHLELPPARAELLVGGGLGKRDGGALLWDLPGGTESGLAQAQDRDRSTEGACIAQFQGEQALLLGGLAPDDGEEIQPGPAGVHEPDRLVHPVVEQNIRGHCARSPDEGRGRDAAAHIHEGRRGAAVVRARA
mmetsp:Transcript_134672/g.430176  ORF Transcript_134672/g.430176 Transcript_134672/m.430176 type:complete len:208 (-) Transcript_134672:714-1337(-)